uniref:Uncharacterized protein n=1 Tax=Arundo donax TaxID=35708 RepID=A0A0A9BE41_ARUDO
MKVLERSFYLFLLLNPVQFWSFCYIATCSVTLLPKHSVACSR